MTPETVNRLSQWGLLVLLVVSGVVLGAQWASGSSDNAVVDSAVEWPTDTVEAVVAGTSTTTTVPVAASAVIGRPDTTRYVASTTSTTALETTITSTTTPTATTTPVNTTSTTTATTTPTTATSTTSSTTTTTSTTSSTTTTTTVAGGQGLFIGRFDGEARGDEDVWSAELLIDLKATAEGSRRAEVLIAWSGDGAGQKSLTSNGNGTVRATLGSFRSKAVTFLITDVRSAKWVYVPDLNQTSTSLTIVAPDDDD